MARVVVTGAAGFIGSHTVDALLAGGHEVVGVDNFRTGRPKNLAEASRSARFSLRREDLTEPGLISRLVGEVRPDALIHLAALVSVPESVRDPAGNFRLNVYATEVVAEAARRHGVGRLVFASSAAVYGEPDQLPLCEGAAKRPASPYGAAKLASELLLESWGRVAGFSTVCLRYFNVFGPRQDPASPYSGVITLFDRCSREGRPPTIFGDGCQTRDFVAVADVARANVLAALTPGLGQEVMNVCTGQATSLLQLAEWFGARSAVPVQPTFAAPRAGDLRHSVGDPKAARERLGFSATVSVESGLASLTEP